MFAEISKNVTVEFTFLDKYKKYFGKILFIMELKTVKYHFSEFRKRLFMQIMFFLLLFEEGVEEI